MKPTLYHYSHCPYCIRVRMAAGYLGVNYDTKLVRYDDEETPMKLIGRKMLPIWVNESGNAINESLDIVSLIDTDNKLKTKETLSSPEWKIFDQQLNELSSYIHNLAMPHFVYTKEFDEKSRAYFRQKKEAKRGPFEVLIKNRNLFERELNDLLLEVEKNISEYYKSKTFSLYDIVLAAHLWGMYAVPEFQFTQKMHSYLQKIKGLTHFNYQDFWDS